MTTNYKPTERPTIDAVLDLLKSNRDFRPGPAYQDWKEGQGFRLVVHGSDLGDFELFEVPDTEEFLDELVEEQDRLNKDGMEWNEGVENGNFGYQAVENTLADYSTWRKW